MYGTRVWFMWLAMLPAVASGQPLPQHDEHVHVGVASCASSQCHGSAVPRSGLNVLQSEYVTWTTADPHAGAYRTLTTPESEAITERLGLGPPEQAHECLNCHADNVPVAARGDRFQLSDGVGCEACHGGAEQWLVAHYNDPDAGHLINVEKGLYPTDDLLARGSLCLSCHLGTADKFATHRMMAAGHPRLAFELDTFTELWRLAGSQPHFQVDDDYRHRKSAPDHVSTWAVGLIASAFGQLEFLTGARLTGGGTFPELALFDCHACHRTMKRVAWQPLERYGGAGPGTPILNDSSFVMLIALARALEADAAEALERGLRGLHAANNAGVGAVRDAARELHVEVAGLQTELGAGILSAAVRDRLLVEILTAGSEGELLDYVAAEQAFMAVQMLAFDQENEPLAGELELLARALEDDEAYDPNTFAALLETLNERY